MTNLLDARKSFKVFRETEKKPVVCVYCGRQSLFYAYREWPDSFTNSAPFCDKCSKFYDSVHEKYGESSG